MYNEEAALRRALEESIAAEIIPPEQRIPPNDDDDKSTSTQKIVREMLKNIDICEQKINALISMDLTNTKIFNKSQSLRSPKSKSRKSLSSPQNSSSGQLNTSAEIRMQQDRAFYEAEQRQIIDNLSEEDFNELSFEEEEEEVFGTFSSESLLSQEEEDQQQHAPSVSNDQNALTIALQLPRTRVVYSFMPSDLGKCVYDKAQAALIEQGEDEIEDFQIIAPLGQPLLKDKTLAEQHVVNKTLFSVR